MTVGYESSVRVEVKHSVYKRLRELKQRGETFNDVIVKLLPSEYEKPVKSCCDSVCVHCFI